MYKMETGCKKPSNYSFTVCIDITESRHRSAAERRMCFQLKLFCLHILHFLLCNCKIYYRPVAFPLGRKIRSWGVNMSHGRCQAHPSVRTLKTRSARLQKRGGTGHMGFLLIQYKWVVLDCGTTGRLTLNMIQLWMSTEVDCTSTPNTLYIWPYITYSTTPRHMEGTRELAIWLLKSTPTSLNLLNDTRDFSVMNNCNNVLAVLLLKHAVVQTKARSWLRCFGAELGKRRLDLRT